MRIATLGAGRMTEAIAARWVAAGHDVLIGGRTPDKAAELAKRIGARSGTLREAADFGDVVLLAVLRAGLESTLVAAGAPQGALAGKVVIDCGNAVDLTDFSQVTWDGRSMAEQAQRLAPGSHVVKAFNQCHGDVWTMRPPVFDGRPLAVPIAGDDAAAKQTVIRLVRDIGADVLDAGDLTQARHLEAMAIVIISRLRAGAAPLTAFNLVSADASG